MYDSVIFDLVISRDEFLKFYEGIARDVRVTARDGREVRFPADHLRAFVTPMGIHGTFKMTFDANKKFKGIEQL